MSEFLRKYLGNDSQSLNSASVSRFVGTADAYVLEDEGFADFLQKILQRCETEWDIFWCDKEWMSEYFDKFRFQAHQRINHFRSHYELTRKDLLVRNLRRHRRQLERDGKLEEAQSFNVCPTTFLLPLVSHLEPVGDLRIVAVELAVQPIPATVTMSGTCRTFRTS